MNKLYYGDNLTVLKGCISDESVDLVYLDPPFNSQATYNVLFKSTAGEQSRAQIEAFDDTWHWGDEAELAFDGVREWGVLNGWPCKPAFSSGRIRQFAAWKQRSEAHSTAAVPRPT